MYFLIRDVYYLLSGNNSKFNGTIAIILHHMHCIRLLTVAINWKTCTLVEQCSFNGVATTPKIDVIQVYYKLSCSLVTHTRDIMRSRMYLGSYEDKSTRIVRQKFITISA